MNIATKNKNIHYFSLHTLKEWQITLTAYHHVCITFTASKLIHAWQARAEFIHMPVYWLKLAVQRLAVTRPIYLTTCETGSTSLTGNSSSVHDLTYEEKRAHIFVLILSKALMLRIVMLAKPSFMRFVKLGLFLRYHVYIDALNTVKKS